MIIDSTYSSLSINRIQTDEEIIATVDEQKSDKGNFHYLDFEQLESFNRVVNMENSNRAVYGMLQQIVMEDK